MFRNLMGSQNETSLEKLVSSIASTNNPQSEAMICDLIYEYLKSEHKDTPLLRWEKYFFYLMIMECISMKCY